MARETAEETTYEPKIILYDAKGRPLVRPVGFQQQYEQKESTNP